MRKFFAMILAVLMVVATLAMLPVGAATAAAKDGSTVADLPNKILITELMVNSQSDIAINGGYSNDAFDYMEIHNAGTTPVDVYDLRIMRQNGLKGVNSRWMTRGDFAGTTDDGAGELYIYDGSIYDAPGISVDSAVQSANECENNEDGILQPGETAVIWFWDNNTAFVNSNSGGTLGTELSAGGASFGRFRAHYGIDDDAKIFVVCAMTKTDAAYAKNSNAETFNLSNANNYVYGIVQGVDFNRNGEDGNAENSYSGASPAFTRTPAPNNTYTCTWNEDVLAVCAWGMGMRIPCDNTEGDPNSRLGVSTNYVTANNAPILHNAQEKQDTGTDPNYTDYVAGEYVNSYREMGIACADTPTPGSLTAYQWAAQYATDEKVPADVKQQANWRDTANAYLLAKVQVSENVEDNAETENNNAGAGNGEGGNGGGGDVVYELYPWAIPVIIAGSVVGVGGIVLVVLLVMKKKKTAAVAKEDAPVEEAAEAPVEENKTEE